MFCISIFCYKCGTIYNRAIIDIAKEKFKLLDKIYELRYGSRGKYTSLDEDKVKWMKEGEEYEMSMWNDQIVNVEIQNFIELEISETEPGFKGDTSTNTLKEATLVNGVEIKVPLFVEPGDVVKVDTRNCEYQNRVNK